MASFCPYVRTFDRLQPCTTGTWDTEVLPGTEPCDAMAKLLPCMTVTVFEPVGIGIAAILPVGFCSCLTGLLETGTPEVVEVCKLLLLGD